MRERGYSHDQAVALANAGPGARSRHKTARAFMAWARQWDTEHSAKSAPICDAHYDNRPVLVSGVEGAEWVASDSKCDRESVAEHWHGMDTPANVCHVHLQGIAAQAAFHGHRVRMTQGQGT